MANLSLTRPCLRLWTLSSPHRHRWQRPTTITAFNRHLFGKSWFKVGKPPGVYILFPDVPSDTAENNELLSLPTEGRPIRFAKLSPEKCVKAVAKMSIEFDSCLDKLEQQLDQNKMSQSFDEVMAQIEQRLVPLDYGLCTLRLLRNVDKNRYDFRHFDQFFNRISMAKVRRFQSQPIYFFMREIQSNRDQLTGAQKRVVDKYLLEAKLFGSTLSAAELSALNQIHKDLAEERGKFNHNLMEATRRFTHTVDDPALLAVLPDELIASIGSHSNATVTLHSSVFDPFMEYCPDRALRYNLWCAYNSRAAPGNDRKISNSIIIENIRFHRKQQAKVLGFENYIDLSMETKMAHNLDNVRTFISTLHTKSKPAFDANLKELTDFARESGSHEGEKLELWDLPYWQRKLLKVKYSIEDSAVKQYFPLNAVLDGMFGLAERLFDIKIERVMKVDAWHKDVQLFRIMSTNTGAIVGSFYFDPYCRLNHKTSTSYNELALNQYNLLSTKSVSYLITNFAEPVIDGQSTQLSFSQIISRHVANGSPLPESEFDKIRRAHYHFASFDLKHEIYRMALDLALYSSGNFWSDIRDQVWDEYMTPF
ncbi:unnamed protein product, partial [Medioppia subpectinata]